MAKFPTCGSVWQNRTLLGAEKRLEKARTKNPQTGNRVIGNPVLLLLWRLPPGLLRRPGEAPPRGPDPGGRRRAAGAGEPGARCPGVERLSDPAGPGLPAWAWWDPLILSGRLKTPTSGWRWIQPSLAERAVELEPSGSFPVAYAVRPSSQVEAPCGGSDPMQPALRSRTSPPLSL